MFDFFYVNQEIDLDSLEDQAIKMLLAIDAAESANHEASFQSAVRAALELHISMEYALCDEAEDVIVYGGDYKAWELFKAEAVKSFLASIHRAGYKHIDEEYANESIEPPDTVEWKDLRATKNVLIQAGRAFGSHEAGRTKGMWAYFKERKAERGEVK